MFATIRRFWSTLQPITDNDVIQGWIQLDLVGGGGGGCSGADCRVVTVMCAARPSTTAFEL